MADTNMLKKYMDMALECGFTRVSPLNPETLVFMTEVRYMCADNKCGSYGKRWSCPPACGELPEIELRCRDYTSGMIVQTVGVQEDEFDFAAMVETPERFGESFRELTRRLRDAGADMFPMGAGACELCKECGYPDAPCRFPDLSYPSMEACGLLVSQVCRENDLPYYYGKGSITFAACYLFK